MADKYRCPVCTMPVAITTRNKFRQHGDCDASGTLVSAAQLAKGPLSEVELKAPDVPVEGRDWGHCACGRRVQLNAEGRLMPHFTEIGGTELCGERQPVASTDTPTRRSAEPATPVTDPDQSNGDTTASSVPLSSRAWYMRDRKGTPRPVETVELPTAPTPVTSTPTEPSTTPSGLDRLPMVSPPRTSLTPSVFAQPGQVTSTASFVPGAGTAPTLFVQPGRPTADDVHTMEGDAAEIAASLRQLFFHYGNRRADDNRNNQKHLGPSEIGTPCDRRLVMSLLGVPPSNPGGDGWAAWVGTQGHAGLASMFGWADGGSGRYAVETPLHFPSRHVPRGTGDLLDRATKTFIDHKFMGEWSLKKFKRQGPSPVYRTQIHTYAYGARQRGEQVDRVAIVAWPRQSSSLDDLWVWCEPYDPSVAAEALKRVDTLAAWASSRVGEGELPMDVAMSANHDSSDCRYCPFHAPKDKGANFGCSGK